MKKAKTTITKVKKTMAMGLSVLLSARALANRK
jgi:hypothetical protein